MTILAWQRGGAGRGRPVVLLHDWASDGVADWQDSGWISALDRAGLTAYVPDLPGHAESADVLMPPDAEPAAWTASAILNDIDRLGVGAGVAVVGYRMGCVVAGHVAVRASERVDHLVLIGCDDTAIIPGARQVAAALRNDTAGLWDPEASGTIARAKQDKRHHLPTLAHWAEDVAWPAAPRLGALRTPALLAIGRDDPRRERAPRLAALFHDGHLVTVSGCADDVLRAPEIVPAITRFLAPAPDRA